MCLRCPAAASFFSRLWRGKGRMANGRTGKWGLIGGGEKLGAPRMWLTGKMSRAGFEPRRGCTTSPGLDRPENDDILGDARRTHGSNPARSSQRSGIRFPAPRFSPHRSWVPFADTPGAPFTLVMFGQG